MRVHAQKQLAAIRGECYKSLENRTYYKLAVMQKNIKYVLLSKPQT